MRIFLAGATGVIGQRLGALLREAKHEVTGTTRTQAKNAMLRALDVTPVVVDVFEPDAVARAVATARPDVIIHQLTDLPSAPGTPGYPAAQEANRRLRIEGTRNLIQAAK
jgi:nucleoside-diphosphate-sugar epimerase